MEADWRIENNLISNRKAIIDIDRRAKVSGYADLPKRRDAVVRQGDLEAALIENDRFRGDEQRTRFPRNFHLDRATGSWH
jgi:hypothetical protein